MTTGRVIVWREGEKMGRYFGYIVDAAFGGHCPREASVLFDERDLACDVSEIGPHVPVAFDYDAKMRERGRNPRARNVRPLPMPVKLGEVVKIKPNDHGYYGFIHGDGDTHDFYFTNRTVIDPSVTLQVGTRVRFWHDAGGQNPRARRVEVIEE